MRREGPGAARIRGGMDQLPTWSDLDRTAVRGETLFQWGLFPSLSSCIPRFAYSIRDCPAFRQPSCCCLVFYSIVYQRLTAGLLPAQN